ncbi:similar to flavin-containing monooxygenase family protein [Ectocarpus siliculosus]|uniref:Similar to flavin-containing monooxygenase family protein n=1 Tax=Ectocarpus siliculosus TaxID=2880 RepID=D7FSH9_ECTSI|nr:similar to flavin-containing monooxygenase family protein [Ectocarpus siliculosus]|eukprot:CBJ31120.1 similar to flavin-containing monooxygenase family protein [Ectocarpus siliculosus]
MSYFGFPFPEETQSFSSHAQVLDYLCSYADEHDLHPLISLGCSVESVRLASLPSVGDSSHTFGSVDGSLSSSEDSSLGEGAVTGTDTAAAAGRHGGGIDQGQSKAEVESTTLGRWEVVYRRRSAPAAAAVADDDDQVVAEVFDAVCVCSGHFDETYTPTVAGLDEFQGTVMHAREYDIPGVEAFVGKRVLCVGARSSGTDIAREISSVAHAVHVCDRSNPVNSKGGERGNVWWRTALEKFEGANGVRFKNGELLEVDTVVWCTGYNYAFPFLEGSGLLTAPASKRVHPVFEHLFHVYHPSLSFVGLPQSIVTFPLFELQANAVAAAIVGRASFPSLAEREQWLRGEDDRLREGGVGPSSRGAHVLGGRQWEYLRRLLRIASGPGVLGRGSTAENHPPQRGGGDEGSAVPNASSKEASPSRGAAAATEGGAQQRHQLELERLLNVLNVKEAIYNDAGDNRPWFPGGPDDYRRRQYRVDWDSGRFSVSYADRKANGEGPSSPAAS